MNRCAKLASEGVESGEHDKADHHEEDQKADEDDYLFLKEREP